MVCLQQLCSSRTQVNVVCCVGNDKRHNTLLFVRKEVYLFTAEGRGFIPGLYANAEFNQVKQVGLHARTHTYIHRNRNSLLFLILSLVFRRRQRQRERGSEKQRRE